MLSSAASSFGMDKKCWSGFLPTSTSRTSFGRLILVGMLAGRSGVMAVASDDSVLVAG